MGEYVMGWTCRALIDSNTERCWSVASSVVANVFP